MLCKALEYDPECVMAHWGIAYGCGPFYNMTWRDHSEEEANTATRTAYEHIQKARALAHRATELENWLVETLAAASRSRIPFSRKSLTAGTMTTPRNCAGSIINIETITMWRRCLSKP